MTEQVAPSDGERLVRFYERSYGHEGEQAERYSRWRALGAKGKAEHVIALCSRAGVVPRSTLEVGCGDGALLCELGRRGFGGRLEGVEISETAVKIASARAEIDAASVYDGERLTAPDGRYELGVLSHVLEHVREPARLLAEAGRACKAVVFEVPLEDNLSAKRAGKREHAEEVGHLQRFSRATARAMAQEAGMRIAGELEDPLPLAAQLFFAETSLARVRATIKWAVRGALHRLAPTTAKKLFTVHYACLCMR